MFAKHPLTVAVLAGLACVGSVNAQEAALPDVHVNDRRPVDAPTTVPSKTRLDDLSARRRTTNDTARLLEGIAGVSSFAGGGVSSLPTIDGLADDRLRILVDGMEITSSCPNHMNPALSYIDPGAIERIDVFAGIAPVSVGGDSIGGTIDVRSAKPRFAEAGQAALTEGRVSAFYRSNGNVHGADLSAAYATEHWRIGYTGTTVQSDDYKDANGKLERSTEYKSQNQLLTLATQFDRQSLSVEAGWQRIPYQGYPNQYMDMTDNRSTSFKLRYVGDFDWGELEARAYRHHVRHKMDMLTDKAELGVLTYGAPYAMPMDTEGTDIGYGVQATWTPNERDLLRVGHEYHRYTLDDWWPPLAGSMMMEPNTFWNINGGKRDRLALYAEWEARWTPRWTSNLGARIERVTMNTGSVQGYYATGDDMGMGMGLPDGYTYQNDANAFNAQDHHRTDNNLDLTATTRYIADKNTTLDLGYARKTRSPNLYERFAWSNEASMAGAMISWFGDLNSYVGNLQLKPEVANTLRASIDWHDEAQRHWQLKVAPFFTQVTDYINVEPNLNTTWPAPAQRVALRFVNHDARLFGLDLTARAHLGQAWGDWSAQAVTSLVRGEDRTNDTDLFNQMPPNVRLSFEQKLDGFDNTLEFVAVAAKRRVDTVREEFKTAGYALVNAHSSYTWKRVRIDAGIDNLFNRQYDLPLGGLDFYEYNYLSPATNGHLSQVRGPGRSVSVAVTLNF